MRRVTAWAQRRPAAATVVFAGCAAGASACYLIGAALLAPSEGLPEDQRSLLGRFVAWPGGTSVCFAIGTVILGLLLIPDGRFDGRWRWRLARITWWSTIAFAVLQLLDDHLMGQAGTSNPAHVAIPSPYQDLAELPVMALLATALAAALVSLPFRVVKRSGRRR
jgi:MFS family permease